MFTSEEQNISIYVHIEVRQRASLQTGAIVPLSMSTDSNHKVNKLITLSALGLGGGIMWTVRLRSNLSGILVEALHYAVVIEKSSGYGLAGRAILIATIISTSSLGLATGALAKYLGITSV